MPRNQYSINGGFVILPDTTILSPEYKNMRTATRCVYITMLTRFNRDRKTNPCTDLKVTFVYKLSCVKSTWQLPERII